MTTGAQATLYVELFAKWKFFFARSLLLKSPSPGQAWSASPCLNLVTAEPLKATRGDGSSVVIPLLSLCSPFSACLLSTLLPSSLLITWETWSSAAAPLWITILHVPGKTCPSFASNAGFLLHRTAAPFYCTCLIDFEVICPCALSYALKILAFLKGQEDGGKNHFSPVFKSVGCNLSYWLLS